MCKSADLLLMVLDASKPHGHREILSLCKTFDCACGAQGAGGR